MKFCPKCSSEFENKFKFCREDGTILQTKVLGNTCPKCGNETEEGQKFCRNCGERLNPRGEPPQPTVEPPKIQTAGTQERENLEPAEPIAEPAEIVSAPIGPKVVQQPENTAQGTAKQASPTEVAETCISEGNFQAAITALEPVISNDPRNREVYLLHLLASVKLYGVYGYEKEIESLSGLSGLSEKEKDLAREIFLCRFEEARKRGDEKTASDYQRLAARVVLGQPLQGAAAEAKDEEIVSLKHDMAPAPENRSGDMTPQQPPQFDFSSGDKLDSPERKHSGDAKHKSRGILITAGIVLAVVGVLGGGFVVYYANQGNVNFSWFSRFGIGGKAPGSSDTAQVIAAEELGLKVSGEGAADKNRSASLLSDNINAELDSLRSLYQQQLRANPGLMGSITLQLTVVQTGQVTKVEELASQIKDEGFRKSVAEEVRAWRFAETTLGVVKVDCPLLFIPPGIDVTSIVKWERSIGPRATEPAMLAQADPPNRDSGATPQSPSSTTESTPTKPPPAPPAKPPSLIFYQTLRLTTVYREPREDSQQVASIPEGIKVNVVAVRGEWLEVRSKVGNPPGFIRKDSAVPSGNR